MSVLFRDCLHTLFSVITLLYTAIIVQRIVLIISVKMLTFTWLQQPSFMQWTVCMLTAEHTFHSTMTRRATVVFSVHTLVTLNTLPYCTYVLNLCCLVRFTHLPSLPRSFLSFLFRVLEETLQQLAVCSKIIHWILLPELPPHLHTYTCMYTVHTYV